MKGIIKKLSICLLILLSGCVLAACHDKNSPDVDARVYEQAKPLNDFLLRDQNNNLVTKEAFLGHWNIVFLGYTSCPDICPLTLAKLNTVYKALKDKYPLQVWFVSVDPKRDTANKRKAYIDYFNPAFLAVSGDHKELFPFVRELGLIYAITQSDEPDYAVQHSASVALVNEQGAVSAVFKPEFKQNTTPLINTKKMIKEFKIIADSR